MKKWIAFMLVFVVAFVLMGCTPDGDGPKDKFEVKGVTITENPANMNVGDEVQLKASINPAEADQTVVWTSKNQTVASVSETGLVKALAAGVAEIIATSKVNPRMSKTVSIQVIEPIVYDEPTSVEITGTQSEFGVNRAINLVAKVYPLPAEGVTGAIQAVVWTSSDTSIATVNTSGRVTGVAEGEAVITATVVADDTLSATFNVTVVKVQGGVFDGKPEEIRISGETNVEEGFQIALVASVLPSGVSQNVTWTSETPDILTVNEQGIVTALKAGKGYVKVVSNLDFAVERLYEINVKPAVNNPDPNMNNYEIIIMAAPHAKHEHDPALNEYKGLDKQAKLDSWKDVETRFNVKMTVAGFPESAPWGESRIKWIIEKSELNAAETDIFVSTTDWVVRFAGSGATVDVTPFYEKYGKNSMDPGVKSASSYKGGLYALPSSGVGSIRPYHGLVFNVNLLNSLGLDNPAQLFNEGEWTWSKFKAYVEEASALLSEEQSVLSGKPAGLYYGMASAAGVKLVDPTTMTLNFTHGHAINAANLIRDLYVFNDNVWGDNAWDAQNPSFNTGNSIFQVAEYWFLKDAGRFTPNMWGEGTTRYGYVPFPYPDSMKKNETRVSYQGGAIYQMSSGRVYPTGVSAENVYHAFAEMMLGTTRRMHADPQMNEDVLMRRAAEFKLDDQESITAISYFKGDKVIWDPFYSILPSWSHSGRMIDDVVVLGTDYMQVVDTYDPQFRAALNETFG